MFVAVAHPLVCLPTKAHALLFDSIDLIGIDMHLGALLPQSAAEIEWLMKRGIVHSTGVSSDQVYEQLVPEDARTHYLRSALCAAMSLTLRESAAKHLNEQELTHLVAAALRHTAEVWPVDSEQLLTQFEAFTLAVGVSKFLSPRSADRLATQLQLAAYDDGARVTAICRSALEGVEAVPLVSSITPGLPPTTFATVAEVVINEFPVPDDATPWEAICDFRDDEKATTSLRRLRRWMRSIASEDLPINTIRDEFLYLLDEYQAHLRIHRLKASVGYVSLPTRASASASTTTTSMSSVSRGGARTVGIAIVPSALGRVRLLSSSSWKSKRSAHDRSGAALRSRKTSGRRCSEPFLVRRFAKLTSLPLSTRGQTFVWSRS